MGEWMPSPIGHSIMACLIYRTTTPSGAGLKLARMGLYVFAANAADLDFIPGLLSGDPNRYHHGISHSLGFAALVAVVFGLLLMFRTRQAAGNPSSCASRSGGRISG